MEGDINLENNEGSNNDANLELKREEILSVLAWESEQEIDELLALFRKIWWKEWFERLKKIINTIDDEWLHDKLELYLRDITSWNFKEEIAKEYIKELVLERINRDHIMPFTRWQEGDIYKITLNIEWNSKECVVAKRKFPDSTSWKEEYSYQTKAWNILKDSHNTHSVFVPTPIHYFENKGDEYLIMEYVQWKTLYCLLLESMFKDLLDYCASKWLDGYVQEMNDKFHDRPTTKEILSAQWWMLTDFWKRHYSTDNMPTFEHDWEAARSMMNIIEFVWTYTDFFQKEEFRGLNPSNKRNQEDILTALYLQYSNGCELFEKNEITYFQNTMSVALDELHDHNIYHRDLWQNLRNIMFCYDSSLAIIDFGKSTNTEDYTNIDESGRYDKDEDILVKMWCYEIKEKSESEKEYLRKLQAQKLIDSLDTEWVLSKISDYLGFQVAEKNLPSIKLSTYSMVEKNLLYNYDKSWWYWEHYFFLKEGGEYLSKKEKTMAQEYGDKSSLEIVYLISAILHLTKDDFEKFLAMTQDKLAGMKRTSLKKKYASFYYDILEIIAKS